MSLLEQGGWTRCLLCKEEADQSHQWLWEAPRLAFPNQNMGTRRPLAACMLPHLLCDVLARALGWGKAMGVRGSWAQSRAICTLHELCNQIKAPPASFLPTWLCLSAPWLHVIQAASSKMAQSICTGWLCKECFYHRLTEREAGRQQWQARQSYLTRLFPFGGKLESHIHHKPRKKSIGQRNH